jgi:Fe-S cluster assembly scaffold protein SufB
MGLLLYPKRRSFNGTFYLLPYQSSRNRTVRENIADEGSYVSYLEGCTASRETNCTAVVELVALDGAEIKYSTVQNWYPGNKKEKVVFTIL